MDAFKLVTTGSGYPGCSDEDLRRFDPTLVFLKNQRTGFWLVAQDLRLVPIQDLKESPWQPCVDERLVGVYEVETGMHEFGKPTPYNVMLQLAVLKAPVIFNIHVLKEMIELACPRGGDESRKRERHVHNAKVQAAKDRKALDLHYEFARDASYAWKPKISLSGAYKE